MYLVKGLIFRLIVLLFALESQMDTALRPYRGGREEGVAKKNTLAPENLPLGDDGSNYGGAEYCWGRDGEKVCCYDIILEEAPCFRTRDCKVQGSSTPGIHGAGIPGPVFQILQPGQTTQVPSVSFQTYWQQPQAPSTLLIALVWRDMCGACAQRRGQ
jgi:hypothetical protein